MKMASDKGESQERVVKLCDTTWFCGWFSQAIKFLLENRHLYQSVNIQTLYESMVKNAVRYDWSDMAKMCVVFGAEVDPLFRVELPDTLQLVCSNKICTKLMHPHNLALCVLEKHGEAHGRDFQVYSRTLNAGYRYFFKSNNDSAVVQQFTIQYQCQSCKGEPLTFMIRRDGLKLQLVGRSSIEPCVLPEGFPSEENTLFSDAICASQTGSTLAGICLLRIAIEQYVRRAVKDFKGRDLELIFDGYKSTLPDEYPISCAGLLRIAYDKLSECIHAAKPDGTCFNECLSDLSKHFKMIAAFNFIK